MDLGSEAELPVGVLAKRERDLSKEMKGRREEGRRMKRGGEEGSW